MSKSLIKKYLIWSNLFGLSMGLIFPVYASFFVNYKSPNHKVVFIIGAVLAGLIVGGFSYILTKIFILKVIKELAYSLREIESNNNLKVFINIESRDSIGLLIESTNSFVKKIREDIVETGKYSNKLHKTSNYFKEINSEMNESTALTQKEIISISKYINLT